MIDVVIQRVKYKYYGKVNCVEWENVEDFYRYTYL